METIQDGKTSESDRGTSADSSDSDLEEFRESERQFWFERVKHSVGSTCFDSLATRAAKELVDGHRLTQDALERLLEDVERRRRNRELKNPGSYFWGGLMNLLGIDKRRAK